MFRIRTNSAVSILILVESFIDEFQASKMIFHSFSFPDSPKHQNKSNSSAKNVRNVSAAKRTLLPKSKTKSLAHDIVVVREANKKIGIELDPDIQRLQVSKHSKSINHNDK